jgi:hypothetical protein
MPQFALKVRYFLMGDPEAMSRIALCFGVFNMQVDRKLSRFVFAHDSSGSLSVGLDKFNDPRPSRSEF